MKYLMFVMMFLLVVGCSVKRGENQYNFMQAQVKQGHTTIETESGVGGRVETIGGSGPLDLWLGLVKRTFTMLPPMQCIEYYENNVMTKRVCATVPSVDVDTSLDFKYFMPKVSDTVATGESAENLRESTVEEGTVGGEVK